MTLSPYTGCFGPREAWTWEEWILWFHSPVVSNEDLSQYDREKLFRNGVIPREIRARRLLDAFEVPAQSRLETWVAFRRPVGGDRWTWLYTDIYEPAPSDSCCERVPSGWGRPQCSSACVWQPVASSPRTANAWELRGFTPDGEPNQ